MSDKNIPNILEQAEKVLENSNNAIKQANEEILKSKLNDKFKDGFIMGFLIGFGASALIFFCK